MLAFVDNTISEFKEFIKSWKILVWVIMSGIFLLVVNNGINDYKESRKLISLFKDIHKRYFERIQNYDRYGKEGIDVLFVPSPLSALFKNTIISENLTGNVDSAVNLDISNDLKGPALNPSNLFFKLDFSFILMLVGSMAALLYGYGAWKYREYLHSLAEGKPGFKVYNLVVWSRSIVLLTAFLISAALVLLLFSLRGVQLSPNDYKVLGKFIFQVLGFLLIFFLLGALIGHIKKKEIAYPLLFVSWFAFIFIFTAAVHSGSDLKEKEMTRNLQTVLEKFKEGMNFEIKMEKKFGKFDKNDMEKGRKVIKYYIDNYFTKLKQLEKELESVFAGYINSYRQKSVLTWVTFYIASCNEARSRGYENFFAFYDYLIKMYNDFFLFWVDRVYYNDPEVMVPFIKGDEDLFKGVSRMPSNYWTGNGIQAIYLLFFYFLGYQVYRFSSFHLKSREMDFKGDVAITVKPKELKIFTVDGTRFNRLLRRIFSGFIKILAKKGFKGKILVKDTDISVKKSKNRYLYVCQPGSLPREKKVKDLLTFHRHWSGWKRRHRQPEEKKNLLSKLEKLAPIMNKRISKLNKEEKYDVLMTLVEMQKGNKDVYHFYDPLTGLPEEYDSLFYSLVKELCDDGAIVFFIKPRFRVTYSLEENEVFKEGNGWLFTLAANEEIKKYSEEK
jgi:hypothetical protein